MEHDRRPEPPGRKRQAGQRSLHEIARDQSRSAADAGSAKGAGKLISF
ncbi:MAG: hypothetical protein NTZ09_03125 [Candidatus Hydrogenedentes bacterium]|nr:hypothetical protein [Candidatus Hydrogenedentota bacterium]